MLGDRPVGPVIPVSDFDASLRFYRDALGLSGNVVPSGYALNCGAGGESTC